MRDSLHEVNVHLHIIPERSIFTAERTQLRLVPYFLLVKVPYWTNMQKVNVYCDFLFMHTVSKTAPSGLLPTGPLRGTMFGCACRYRQTPSFQMLISWQPRRSALVSLPLAVSSTS